MRLYILSILSPKPLASSHFLLIYLQDVIQLGNEGTKEAGSICEEDNAVDLQKVG